MPPTLDWGVGTLLCPAIWMQLLPSLQPEGEGVGLHHVLRPVAASSVPAARPSHFTDYSGPHLWSTCSPLATVEQPPRGTPGPAHFFYKPLGLPLLPPTTGYAWGMGQPEVPSPTLPNSAPTSTREPTKPLPLPKSPASLLAPGVPSSGHSPGGALPSLIACVSFPQALALWAGSAP